jgi:hypothetical protein
MAYLSGQALMTTNDASDIRSLSGPTCPPQFFVIAEDLGKSLSRLHKARCRMGEVTGPQQLGIPLIPLETIASTQRVLADEASPRNPPRSSRRPRHSQIPETACAIAGLSVSQRCPQVFPPGGSTEKLGVSKRSPGLTKRSIHSIRKVRFT